MLAVWIYCFQYTVAHLLNPNMVWVTPQTLLLAE